MRHSIAIASLILLCAGTGVLAQRSEPAVPTCADLHLVPAPRECTVVKEIPVGESGVRIQSESNAEDEFASKDLQLGLAALGVGPGTGSSATVRFERVHGTHAKDLFGGNDEGYAITPSSGRGLVVTAETSAGIFYGAQTVKQLLRGSGKDRVLLAPTLRDWPAMPHRGISDDWSRGPLPNMEFLKREIRTLAAYKINIFSPYFEHTFAYSSSPVAAFPGGAMTPDEARELVAYAAQYHITIVPEQESFGHLHHLLKFEQFGALGETPHGSVLAPGDPGTLPLIGSWFADLAKVFPGPYAHIGADETFELGFGQTRDAVRQRGLGAVYLDFLKQIHTTLEPNHKRLLFWGDIAVNSPDLVGTLPKDMIAVPWEYDAKPDFTSLILPFSNAGLETWVAPGVSNWNRVYPNNNEALGNIRAFVRDGQKLGSKGVLNTVWNDDGEGIFDENWFGILFGAAAGWQAGESSEDNFVASFGLAFHADETGKINEAQRELMAAHNLFKKAGLGDVDDGYFWVDPFSDEGQHVSAKLLPVAAELRLHAERAITLLAEARAVARLENRTLENSEALDALELGARRMDFIGLKFQSARDCVALYSRAQTLAGDASRWREIEDILETIGSNNGRLEDIRDGYTQLGQLFSQAWQRDNRPYWLDNNRNRYDRAAQLWMSRAERWGQVTGHWEDTHTLPPLSEVGFPAATPPGN